MHHLRFRRFLDCVVLHVQFESRDLEGVSKFKTATNNVTPIVVSGPRM